MVVEIPLKYNPFHIYVSEFTEYYIFILFDAGSASGPVKFIIHKQAT